MVEEERRRSRGLWLDLDLSSMRVFCSFAMPQLYRLVSLSVLENRKCGIGVFMKSHGNRRSLGKSRALGRLGGEGGRES